MRKEQNEQFTEDEIGILITWGQGIEAEYGDLTLEEIALQAKLQELLANMQTKEAKAHAE